MSSRPWLQSALLGPVLVLAVGAGSAESAAQEVSGEVGSDGPSRETYGLSPATSPIQVDGVLDETAWEDATVIPLAYQWFPRDTVEAPVATECLVTFDRSHLYVAFRARDPDPSRIRAYYADRDTALGDDSVGIFIDTFNDRRRAFYFRVNPLGVQIDATVSDVAESFGETQDLSWNAIWDSAGRITEEGYTVEIAIPFEQLRFPRTRGEQTWGFLAQRTYPRSFAHDIRSSRLDESLDCLVCQFDTVTGLTGMDPGYNLEVVPTVTAGHTAARPRPDAPLETTREEVDAGLSARWGITPNVSFNATVNPDFSQVEADAAQLDVNETFALFFPEKRPFFLEGSDFFETLLPAVFTRTVADPTFGLKLTGKEGPNAFGVLVAEDRLNNLIFPGAEASRRTAIRQDVRSAFLRYRRDVRETSTFGLLYTGRDGRDYHNHVVGLDGTLRLTRADTLRFQVLGSDTSYPGSVAQRFDQPAGSFRDAAWRLDYSHVTRKWFWFLRGLSWGEDFRADSGFMPRVDYRDALGAVRRSFWGEPGGWYSRFQVQIDAQHGETQAGETLTDSANFTLTYEGPNQSLVRLAVRPNRETFRGETFDNLRGDLLVELRPRGDLGLSLLVRGGEVIDRTNVRQAEFLRIQSGIDFRLGRHFRGELEHVSDTFWLPGGDRFLEAALTQTTLVYNFNVRTFVRAIVQYRDVERDLSLHDPEAPLRAQEESLLTQLLFSYKVNPVTVVFLGYSDFHEGFDELDLRQRDRTFFLKVGYAFLK